MRLPKLIVRVRFLSPAPGYKCRSGCIVAAAPCPRSGPRAWLLPERQRAGCLERDRRALRKGVTGDQVADCVIRQQVGRSQDRNGIGAVAGRARELPGALGPQHRVGAGAAVQPEVARTATLAGHGRLAAAVGLHGVLDREVACRGHEGLRGRRGAPGAQAHRAADRGVHRAGEHQRGKRRRGVAVAVQPLGRCRSGQRAGQRLDAGHRGGCGRRAGTAARAGAAARR